MYKKNEDQNFILEFLYSNRGAEEEMFEKRSLL